MGNGCNDTLFNNCLVGIEERFNVEEVPLVVYPNPASDALSIDCTLPSGGTKATLSIFGMDGRLREALDLVPGQSGVQLSLENYASGIYLCNLTSDGKVLARQKFIVVK